MESAIRRGKAGCVLRWKERRRIRRVLHQALRPTESQWTRGIWGWSRTRLSADVSGEQKEGSRREGNEGFVFHEGRGTR